MHQRPRILPKNPRGFTMIEVLIVIAIIVILAAIVVGISLAVASGAKEKATRATLKNLRK